MVAVNGPGTSAGAYSYQQVLPANRPFLEARPAGFEPATGGLEVRDEHLPLRVVLCRKVLVYRKSVALSR
jgi:hypothetical protein